jgi:hypothetical protein
MQPQGLASEHARQHGDLFNASGDAKQPIVIHSLVSLETGLQLHNLKPREKGKAPARDSAEEGGFMW